MPGEELLIGSRNQNGSLPVFKMAGQFVADIEVPDELLNGNAPFFDVTASVAWLPPASRTFECELQSL